MLGRLEQWLRTVRQEYIDLGSEWDRMASVTVPLVLVWILRRLLLGIGYGLLYVAGSPLVKGLATSALHRVLSSDPPRRDPPGAAMMRSARGFKGRGPATP